MGYPLTELISQLSPRRAELGRIVMITGRQALAATPNGRRTVAPATAMQAGDRVVIRDGLAYRLPLAQASVAV
jgi:hypothetical protein